MQKDSINSSGAITLEDLARMVARGFSSMEERFDLRMGCLETKMDGLDIRMDGLETRMDNLNTRMDTLDTRMGGLETRMGGLEMRMETLEVKLDKGFREVHERLDRVEIQQGGGVLKKRFGW
jgi:chaperonin cofactor prefoldin